MMSGKFCVLLSLLVSTGCGNNASQLVTLYRESVSEGNGIVSVIRWNDPNGIWAIEHCKALEKYYERENGQDYICSTVVFDEYKPRIKWW